MLELLGTKNMIPKSRKFHGLPRNIRVFHKNHGKIRLEEQVPGFPKHHRNTPETTPRNPRAAGPGKEVRFQFGVPHRLQKIHLRSLEQQRYEL